MMKRAAILAVLVVIGAVGFCQALALENFNVIERPICVADGDQINLDAAYHWIVWQDNRNGNWDVYFYDYDNDVEKLVCTADGNQVNPCISYTYEPYGLRVVWQDDRNGNWDIYCAQLSLDKLDAGIYQFQEEAICVELSDQMFPDLSERYVVWQDMRSGGWDILGYDLADGNEIVVCDETGSQMNPAIQSEGEVVWEDWRNGGSDIYWYNINDGNSFAVCTAAGDQLVPEMRYQDIVWQDNRNGNWDIYAWDRTSDNIAEGNEVAICIDANSQKNPSLWSSFTFEGSPINALWQDDRNGNWDIWAYNKYNDREFVICDAQGDQSRAVMVDDSTVYWQDNRNGDWDIYMGRVCPKGNDSCDDCMIELMVDGPYLGTTQGMTELEYMSLSDDGSTVFTKSFTSSCGNKDVIDAWFIFEPTMGGPVTIAVDGEFDTTLAVYNGPVNNHCWQWDLPTELVCNDDYCTANTNSRIVMDVVKGKIYYIRVAGFNYQVGDYSIVITQGGQAGNSRSDLNGDGVVDWQDFAIFSSEWLLGAE